MRLSMWLWAAKAVTYVVSIVGVMLVPYLVVVVIRNVGRRVSLFLRDVFRVLAAGYKTAVDAIRSGRTVHSGTFRANVKHLLCRIDHRLVTCPFLVPISLLGLCAGGVLFLFGPRIPESIGGLLVSALLMSGFYFITWWAGTADPTNTALSIGGWAGYAVLVAGLTVGLASKHLLFFPVVFVSLVLFLVPFFSLVRAILASSIEARHKPVTVAGAITISLADILYVLGLFNSQGVTNDPHLTSSSLIERVLRTLQYGGRYVFNFPNPTEVEDVAAMAQFLLGLLFITLVVGSLAGDFRELFNRRTGTNE